MPYLTIAAPSRLRASAQLGDSLGGEVLSIQTDHGLDFASIANWQLWTRQHGGVPVRYTAGEWYGRYGSSAPFTYRKAPPNVQKLEAAERAKDAAAIAAGQRVEAVEKAVKQTVSAAGDLAASAAALPRKTIAAVLGVPEWVVPLALGAGVIVVARAVLPALPGIAHARLTRTTPAGRRRGAPRRRGGRR